MSPTPNLRARTRATRRFGAVLAAIAVAIATLGPVSTASAAPPADSSVQVSASVADTRANRVAPLANLANFRPGNIISDAVFFNSSAMSAAQVDTFIKAEAGTCRSGYTCLKDYRQSTPNRAADSYCTGYKGGTNESAATIIYKSAVACGVNPQVLLVMLEKEQSLVTHTWPSQWRYDMALGQGCPDTAPCDPAFSGFFYQIYGAARQMQIYAEGKWFTWYAPGKTWNILYNPNSSCGSSPVYIENKATAALYYYTPYQPNAAALRAGYGTGDGCSAYGNRNFFNFFEDWFGSTQTSQNAVSAAITKYWNDNGGSKGWLGNPTNSGTIWGASGSSQWFTGGDIYARADGRVFLVGGSIRTEYRLVGNPSSGLGWPTSNRIALGTGAYQDFDNGRIYERSDGKSYAIAAPMFAVHEGLGNISGRFGWPTSRAYAIAGGSIQTFTGGSIYQSNAGTFALSSGWASWFTANNAGSALGFPVTGEVAAKNGYVRVAFAKAAVYRAGNTTIQVKSPFLSTFAQQKYETGALGQPTANAKAIGSAQIQEFAAGQIHSSSAGTFSVTKLAPGLAKAGGVGKVGAAVANQVTSGNATSQRFGTMTLTAGPAGSHVVKGAIRTKYDQEGGAASFLGAAKGPESAVGTGYVQNFDGGRIIVTPSMTLSMSSAFVSAWDAQGGPTGRLGWPLAAPAKFSDGTSVQEFAGGVIMSHASHGTYPLFGLTLRTYRVAGGTPTLGAPTSAETKIGAGYTQTFAKGVVFVPFNYPASAVVGKEYTEFVKGGGLAGFGVATNVASVVGSGKVQPFQLGSISVSPTGTWAVRGSMRSIHDGSGAYTGPLGFPTESERKVLDGYVQNFQGGTAYVSPYAMVVTRGALHKEFVKAGGVSGKLGWPISNETSGNGVWTQKFQHGSITLYADGRVVVATS